MQGSGPKTTASHPKGYGALFVITERTSVPFGSEAFFVQYAEAGIKNPRVSTREPPQLFVYIEQFLGKETRIWHFLWIREQCSWGA